MNTLVLEDVKAALKPQGGIPNQMGKGEEASINMEEFNYDPASDLESK